MKNVKLFVEKNGGHEALSGFSRPSKTEAGTETGVPFKIQGLGISEEGLVPAPSLRARIGDVSIGFAINSHFFIDPLFRFIIFLPLETAFRAANKQGGIVLPGKGELCLKTGRHKTCPYENKTIKTWE
ncbi:MAG TPA: hypothetical protein VNL73_07765 [Verrucomicrobiae bacterium]|nr:hypothetical protein [Verrucomicrobiae bacterium]